MMYELVPRYSTRKSFYGKANVRETKILDEIIYDLISYSTLVAKVRMSKEKTEYIYLGHYSTTTTSHQKEFFKQFGLNDKEIKEVIKKGSLIK